jgi:anti-sigma factor RsiW
MSRARLSGTPPPKELTPGERFELEAWLTSHPEHQWASKRLDSVIEECLDHFRGTGELGYDWVATCRNWIRRAPQFNPSLKASGALKLWEPEIVPEGDRMSLRGNLSQILRVAK